jgi:hypothetical protein
VIKERKDMLIEVGYQIADKITLDNLKVAYGYFCDDVERLEGEDLEEWQREDFEYAKKMRKALKKVISYYMTQSEQEDYFNAK